MKIITVAEIGINHNGSIDVAKKLIDVCSSAGMDFVKFQKRTPELCVPDAQKSVMRETPWGSMTYLEYKNRIEFGKKEYDEIERHCWGKGIRWTASAWDSPSLQFLVERNVPFIKIPSACAVDIDLMDEAKICGIPLVVSTGMCDDDMVNFIVDAYGGSIECLMHCVSTYPSKASEQNLLAIPWMREQFPGMTIGFSNHFPGLTFIPAAIALGCAWVEFHVTLDRSMWGTDQAASIEPEGVFRLMKWIHSMEEAMGDGKKAILDAERPVMKRLRRISA